tara:strand:- start:92 stop:376 length:285 start_codon:yes stop_codon:yes gene_type:complete
MSDLESDLDSDSEREATIEDIQDYIEFHYSKSFIDFYTPKNATLDDLTVAVIKGMEDHIETLIEELNELRNNTDNKNDKCGITCNKTVCFCGSV